MADIPDMDALVEAARKACADANLPWWDEEGRAILAAVLPLVTVPVGAEWRKLTLAYVNLLEIGRDRIVSLGGDCDPVDVMEAGDPALRSARLTLSQLKALGGTGEG